MATSRKVPRPFSYGWGSGQVVGEAAVIGEHHEPVIQLLRYEGGDHDAYEAVRFCFYNLRGGFQRSPLMVGPEEIAELREALKATPRLRALIADLVRD